MEKTTYRKDRSAYILWRSCVKIAICSDLHLEFGTLELKNEESADVLILGGDICVASDLANANPNNFNFTQHYSTCREFFNNVSYEFPHVIFIMGNHEHYHGDYAKTASVLRNFLKDYTNVYLMDQDVKEINDVTFLGGTLWTDMNKEDETTLRGIKHMMNDFNCVKNSLFGDRGKFTPEDALQEHKEFLDLISKTVDTKQDQKFVVVGHHAPTKNSTHPRYAGQFIMNGGYSSELQEFIYDRPQIKLWTHGHTHDDFDYMVHKTRVICNPRGYDGYEYRAADFKLKYVEV